LFINVIHLQTICSSVGTAEDGVGVKAMDETVLNLRASCCHLGSDCYF